MNTVKKKTARLQVLYLEDSDMDAELVQDYLQSYSIYDIHMDVAPDKEAYFTFISTKKYDIILSDFSLHNFDAFAALAYAKSMCPNTPFICVSGNIGEETAVELLKQGTADYTMKNNLGRLVYSIERAMTVSRDQKKLKKAQESLAESEIRYKTMIAKISDVISIMDQSGMVKYCSPNVKKWFGLSPKDLIGSEAWDSIHPNEVLEFKKVFYSVLKKDGMIATANYRFRCKDGSYKFIQLTATNLINNPNIKGVLVNYHDISNLKDKEDEILYLGYHDYLTGLYNRIFFEEEKKRLDTLKYLPISLILGDINGLKLINDAFGYAKGDEVLIEIAKILKRCCREDDVVSRIGGDEFGILMPRTDYKAAQLVCNRISKSCETYVINENDIYPSISLGHATKRSEAEKIDVIFKDAEELMNKHKLLESKSAHSSIIASIKTTMFEKSQETEEHAERLVLMSKSLGQTMGLNEDQLSELDLLSTLHDIGKMSIDKNILSKPGKLNDEEWIEMRRHPEVGYRIALATSELIPIAKYILCHHERWDGKGYPQGLSGEKIPLPSRILSIVDSYDAMTNKRPYRSELTKAEAIQEINRNLGAQFDPVIGKLFVAIISQDIEAIEASIDSFE